MSGNPAQNIGGYSGVARLSRGTVLGAALAADGTTSALTVADPDSTSLTYLRLAHLPRHGATPA